MRRNVNKIEQPRRGELFIEKDTPLVFMRRSRMPYYIMHVYPGATVNEDQKSKTKEESHKTKVRGKG